jgi:dolichol-phosphate mannosyltransferase
VVGPAAALRPLVSAELARRRLGRAAELGHGAKVVLSSLSIVIPAYNEAASIAATVADALAAGAAHAHALEVVVCDDGSRDATGALLADLAMREPRLAVLRRPANRGIEASIRALYAHARHDWVFLNSADRQWPMSALAAMAEAAEAGADFVIGVRRNKRAIYTPYRQVISWSYERIVRALGAPGGDPGSIKLARRALLHRPVVAAGVFAEGERVIRAARGGARVVEVPVAFARRAAGKATGARRDVVARALLDCGRVAASLVLGAPAPRLPVPDVAR